MKKQKQEMFQGHQGDIFFRETDDQLPKDAEKVEAVKGCLVIAYGEATGHCHFVPEADAELWRVSPTRMVLKTKRATRLTHGTLDGYNPDHGEIILPGEKIFEIRRQENYVRNMKVLRVD